MKDGYKEIAKKVYESFYNSTNYKEYIVEFKEFNEQYQERARGKKKLNLFIDFILGKLPEVVSCLSMSFEVDKKEKINNILKKIGEMETIKELLEEKVSKMKEVNQTQESRVRK